MDTSFCLDALDGALPQRATRDLQHRPSAQFTSTAFTDKLSQTA